MDDGVPILLYPDREVRSVSEDHMSNAMDQSVIEWLASLDGYSLNLGGGATVCRPPRCVEVEYAIFRNTTAVADAHHLPFKDETFDAVVSYNTFEHLADPASAAQEILRVLKPGGKLRLQTAFLQPLHEEPAHFYNVTEYGLRQWFSGFVIDRCFVPPNMLPPYALGWLSSMLLWHVRDEQGSDAELEVGRSTLGYWNDFYAKRFEPASGAALTVGKLTQQALAKLSFGFELHASAPMSGGVTQQAAPPEEPVPAAPTIGNGTLDHLVGLLRCPCCSGTDDLVLEGTSLSCPGCGRTFPVVEGVPILLCEDQDVTVMPADHVSNPIDESALEWLDSLDGYSLNLGAGATVRRPARCVEVEYSIFRNTTAVADAHHLPFKDNTFEAVVSYNTFEHLADPATAAREILRVLKPGGKLRLQTAFLQPLHEEPAHFYNATEYGVRQWFSGFEIDRCFVPPEMGPAHMLGWLSNHVLWHIGAEQGQRISGFASQISLRQWARFWDDPASRHGFLKVVFDRLPQSTLSRFSAGFEVQATKPPGTGGLLAAG
jgi:ubiquinone/menaquinone biosynthesis C-methylase UbiE/uncharacterized protein YbaR (Trm112 family)